jgi:DNA-binding response OmpR family regulator
MAENVNVLIVDDEERMRELLSLYLSPKGFKLYMASHGNMALDILRQYPIDVILLDIMMPGSNGFQICEQIRKKYDIPIIMITARSSNEDIVKGLHLGSDDYITKPFDEYVLLARIDAVLRRGLRTESNDSHNSNISDLNVNEDAYQISYGYNEIPLTRKEFELINHFIKHPRRVYKREQLMEYIWGYDSNTEDRTIDSHVRNIRDKFRRVGFPIDEYFKTIWGVGYRWDKEV